MSSLGTTDAGEPLSIDLDALVGSHACVVANSGGGKSGLLRRLLETTHGKIQHIVLDIEDEFYTLREHFDYVIAGGDGGDVPATVEGAAGLALAALTHGFSLIVQLNDLGEDAPEFVGRFLTALIGAPRNLWHPCLVVVDEVQNFAPTDRVTAATPGVKKLTGQGRKRGFTAILASQRISKISADVRGDINNWMLGRVGQTLDRDIMADQLGFTRAQGRERLRMADRTFWGFGPAIAREPVLFWVADVETTLVKSGQAKVPTPPAPEALRAILSGLVVPSAELDATDDLDTKLLRGAEVRQLREARDAFEQRALRAEDMLGEFISAHGLYEQALNGFADTLKYGHAISFSADQHLKEHGWTSPNEIPGNRPGGGPSGDAGQTAEPAAPVPAAPRATAPAPAARTATEKAGGGNASPADLNGIAQTILANLRLIWPARLTWQQAAQMAGRSPKSGPYFAAKKQLVAAGVVETDEVQVWASGSHDRGLTREEAIDVWRNVTEGFAPRMLWVLADDKQRTRDELGADMSVSTKSGPWFGGLKQLRERGLITEAGNVLRLANPLPGERA
jgi:hypothetical protein